MIKELNVDTWKRHAQYKFFISYDDPTFNVTANVDVTNLRKYAKDHELSFFLASLFVSTKAVNLVEEFRYRIRGDKVVIHDVINAGSTFLLDDDTFTFAYFDYCDDILQFCKSGRAVLAECKGKGGLDSKGDEDSLIYYSVVPWISFTSLKNPSQKGKNVSIPKIVFGKYFESVVAGKEHHGETKLLMPVSVEAHHALMDGFHLGKYYETFQSIVDSLGVS